MKIEGHFTSDEIRSAMALGATTERLAFKRITLNFPNQAAYDKWFSQQKSSHPNLWGMTLTLVPRLSDQ